MAGWTSAEEQDILEYWFAGTALPRTPSHIALFTTEPTADTGAGVVEVTIAGAYTRDPFAKNSTNWGGSTAADPSTISNQVAVTFAEATASWGTIKGWGYYDAATVGNLLFFASLDTDKAVNNGDTAQFGVGDLVAKLGDPGDTYT
jgi:hypothetical protein